MRLLDLLIATLVLYPALTGWMWFAIPGSFSFEPTDLGVPLLVAGLVVVGVRRLASEPWHRAELARAAARAALASGVFTAVFLAALGWLRWSSGAAEFDPGMALWYLTHDGGAVVVVALVAFGVRRWTNEPWDGSFFFRLGTRLAGAWLQALERSPARALWTAAAAAAALYMGIALVRHRGLESHGFDLGIFTNAIWNLTQGNGYVSSMKGGINLFADHQSPLFWLLAPVFWLVPRPETLLVAQACGLAAGGPALFYLARTRLGRGHWAAAALPWVYWSWLPLRNANAFDFHPEVFMLPLFLWAFVGFFGESRRAKALGVLALLGALAAKESAAVVAVGIGAAWALCEAGERRSPWPGIALAAGGFALFIFDVHVVPRVLGVEYAYMGLYDRFGGGLMDLLLAPFTQPAYFFAEVINRERLNFLFWTLAPLGFLPLFHWRAALALVPPYAMLFLSEGDQRVRIIFHYGIEPGSALFWALPFGLAVFARRFGWRTAGLWMLFWAVACFGPGELARARGYLQTPHVRWLAQEALPCLDRQAAMAASDVLVPQLATRQWISFPNQLRQHPLGEPVRCVVTEIRLSNWPLGRAGVDRLLADLPSQGYREAYRCGTFSVHETQAGGCLRCVPRCPEGSELPLPQGR